MCGLVGVAGDISKKDEKAFEMMLVLDSTRGPHSTGVLSVPRYTPPKVTKVVGSPWELFANSNFNKMMGLGHRVLMGHNRYATKGAITNFNAHPFQFRDIIGAHNGTLRQQYLLDDYLDFEVDSENIFYDMQRNGAEATIPKIGGAYCLSWWDNAASTMNFIRNNERPLVLCASEDGKCVYWASESWMLSVALSKQGIKHGPIEELPVNQLTSFPVDKTKNGSAVLGKLRIKTVEGYKPPPPALNNWNRNKGNVSHLPAKKGKKNGNVSKQSGSSSVAPVGEELEFKVTGSAKTAASLQPYLTLALVGNKYSIPEMRIYPESSSAMWTNMLASKNTYLVKVQSYNGKGDYFTGQLKSIRELVPDDDDSVTLGVCGLEVTEGEWTKIMQEGLGCSWCKDKPPIEDWAEIEWLDDDEYLCKKCTMSKHVGGSSNAH